MIVKYFKNGNIHIQLDDIEDNGYYCEYDSFDISESKDKPTYADMCCIIYNSMLDCVDYENFDYYFSCIAIINHATDEAYDYVIPYESIDDFFNGKRVILRPEGKHAYVRIPKFYDSYDITIKEKKYTLYKLTEKPSDEFIEEMKYHKCLFKLVSPMYAPEIVHSAMLVPHGTMVRFD